MLRRPAVRQVFYKQVLFTGIQALLPVTVAGLAVGIGLLSQMRSLLGSGTELNVKMLQLVVMREFAPLLSSFIVLGRSGSASRLCAASRHGTYSWPSLFPDQWRQRTSPTKTATGWIA